jgi:hypothetical protein
MRDGEAKARAMPDGPRGKASRHDEDGEAKARAIYEDGEADLTRGADLVLTAC